MGGGGEGEGVRKGDGRRRQKGSREKLFGTLNLDYVKHWETALGTLTF